MICWITERVGTAPAQGLELPVDARAVDVRTLVDKSGNTGEAVREKVREALGHLDAGHRVVISCDYGISRSNAVATAVIADNEKISFEDALARVTSATGETRIRIEVLAAARDALGTSYSPGHNKDTPRVLISGAGGFVGRHAVRALAASGEVFAPCRSDVDLLAGATALDNFVRRHGVTHILHLAAPRVYTNNAALGETLTMLRNVIDVSLLHDLHLTYPSRWEVFSGYRTAGLTADEGLPPLPSGPYGETKYLAEALIAHHVRIAGLRAAVIRSGPVYGEDGARPHFIQTFVAQACAGHPITTHRYRNGDPALDLLHVSDCVAGLTAVVRASFQGTVHLGTGRLVSTPEVARILVSAFDSLSTIEHVDIASEVGNIAMDATRARKLFGWQPLVTVEDGLRKMARTKGNKK